MARVPAINSPALLREAAAGLVWTSTGYDEAPETEDDDASWGGLPFLQPPDGMAEDEWIDFVRHYESEYISDLPVADVIS